MDREVQLSIIGIVGISTIMTIWMNRMDLAQVCIAGLIGFLSGKANLEPQRVYYPPVTAEKEEKIEEKEEIA